MALPALVVSADAASACLIACFTFALEPGSDEADTLAQDLSVTVQCSAMLVGETVE